MKRVVTSALMKQLDQNTIEQHQVPSLVLMERAALAVVNELMNVDISRVLVICGNGNNGADGIAVARMLVSSGHEADVWIVDEEGHKTEECVRQLDIARSYGVSFVNNPSMREYTSIVDAIFGVGLSREITGIYEEAILKINKAKAPVIAVDIPSGICSDTGCVLGCAVQADATVTFSFEKAGLLLNPGMEYAGKVVLADVGIYWDEAIKEQSFFRMDKSDLRLIPKRRSGGNKGTFGKAFLIAGSPDMAGAAYLSGLAAFRTGCGMVKIATPFDNRLMLQKQLPEAMLSIYRSEEELFTVIEKGLEWADVIAIGPGLGRSETAARIVEYLLEHNSKPTIMDADALYLVGEHPEWLLHRKDEGQYIVTPHLGEMHYLTKDSMDTIKENLPKQASSFAKKYQVQCVLKDARTCIATKEGTVYINTTGNCGMATAGSGDVLTGIILGLLSQGTDFSKVGALGCFIHGMLGDMLAKEKGTAYLMATDLIEKLSEIKLGDHKGDRYETI